MSAAASVTVVLVDGSNVARCGTWRAACGDVADDLLRRRLVDAICSWAGAQGREVVVAFDGAGPWQPGVARVSDRVEVVGSGADEGDTVIERRAAGLRRAGTAHWLVTSDRELRYAAGIAAERVIGADEFAGELGAGAAADSAARRPVPDAAPTRLGDGLDDEVRARLERMRRGEL